MFLISIAADICATKDKKGHHVLAEVEDKVVQDITGEEGTGIWSNTEAIQQHVPAPTLSTAHFLRIVSADRSSREHVEGTFHGSFLPQKISFKDESEKAAFLEDLRWAVYSTCLASFVQGMNVIDQADKENKWSINFNHIVQIWRNGCIIRADHIADLLEGIFSRRSSTSESPKSQNHNLLYESKVVDELKRGFKGLKRIVANGVEANAIIPSMSATLEYLKYSGNLKLPTQFYEAELDYFGKHMYDKKGEDNTGGPTEGKHHYEWKAA
jgi:6-phosphogluconate dehydrogenase